MIVLIILLLIRRGPTWNLHPRRQKTVIEMDDIVESTREIGSKAPLKLLLCLENLLNPTVTLRSRR